MPRRYVLSACLSVFGALLTGYFAGAVVIFFQLPTSGLLCRALMGGGAWRQDIPPPPASTARAKPSGGSLVDQSAETFDGFTLYACFGSPEVGTEALLVNMRREVVHRWAVPFSRVWPQPMHLKQRVPDLLFCFFACHLFPNGDLLVVFHGKHFPVGCGLAKLDKGSNVVWAYGGPTHHGLDVAEDGTIFVIEQRETYELPKGLERIPTPCLVDDLVMLSPDGKPVREPIPILEAFVDTPYAELLEAVKSPVVRHAPPPGASPPKIEYDFMTGDPLHTNSVHVLRRDMAAQFPLFKTGQVLVSIRHLATVAMIDPESRKVVWAARGPWYGQHNARFLANGHLLLYDNLGVAYGSRVLEYDPQTQGFPWAYAGPHDAPFYSSERGTCQRLPNGNTLIANTEGREILEVTPQKDVVWSLRVPYFLTTAHRYAPGEVPFLRDQQPRP